MFFNVWLHVWFLIYDEIAVKDKSFFLLFVLVRDGLFLPPTPTPHPFSFYFEAPTQASLYEMG